MSDKKISRIIWLLIASAIVSLFPFTIFSTFLVPIADATGHAVAEVGTLRGLGGIAALIVGVSFAPLINRFVKSYISIFALLLLSASSFVGMIGTYPALIIFCFGIGAATALLTPSLLAIATEQFTKKADSARAATIVTATQSLAAVMAGPVIGGMALLGGWRGAFAITGAITLLAAALFVWQRHTYTAKAAPNKTAYLDAFRHIRVQPLLIALITIAMLRTAAFMGYLSYAAAVYSAHFGLDAYAFTFVWTVSGVSFFVGNFFAGKYINSNRHFRLTKKILLFSLVIATLAAFMVFTTHIFALALVATILMGASHAVVAACITTLIVREGGEATNPALSINSAGMSLGVFVGAAAGGLGLSIADYTGAAVALAGATAIGLLLAMWLRIPYTKAA